MTPSTTGEITPELRLEKINLQVRRSSFFFLFIPLISGLLWGCTSSPKKSKVDVQKNISYAEGLMGDLWIPQGTGPYPILVMVHGGGWQRRTRDDMNPMAQFFAERGYLVFNISYRMAPQNPFPAAIQDYLKATSWIKTEAPKYNGNTHRIFAIGYSAGAHIVSLGALLDPTNPEHHKIADPKLIVSAKVKAVSAGGTPADLTVYEDSKLVVDFLQGKTRPQAPELYTLASPAKQVHPQSPPFFLYHGENDWIVEHNQMKLFKEALLKKNIRVETHDVAWIGHVATFLYSEEPLKLSDQFFRSIPSQ